MSKLIKNKHSTPLLTPIQAVISRQNILNIAQDSGTQATRNDLATPLELSLKIEERDSGVSECFLCRVFDNSTFLNINSADHNHSIPNCSQIRKSCLSYTVNHCMFRIFLFRRILNTCSDPTPKANGTVLATGPGNLVFTF